MEALEIWEQMFAKWLENKRAGTKPDKRLKSWIQNQRSELGDEQKRVNDPVRTERFKRLTEAGFCWNERDAAWDKQFEAYCPEQDSCQEGSEALQNWKAIQRRDYWNGTLRQDRKQRLIARNFDWGKGPKGMQLLKAALSDPKRKS